MSNYISYNDVVNYVQNLATKITQETKKEQEELHNRISEFNVSIKNMRKKIELLEEGQEQIKKVAQEKLDCDKVEAERTLKSFQHKFDMFGINLLTIDASLVNWTQAVHRCQGGMSAKHRSQFYDALDTYKKASSYDYYSRDEEYIRISQEIQKIKSDVNRLEQDKAAVVRKLNENINTNITSKIPDDLTDLDDNILFAITEWLEEDYPDTINIVEEGQLMVYWRDVTIFFSDHEKIEFILKD